MNHWIIKLPIIFIVCVLMNIYVTKPDNIYLGIIGSTLIAIFLSILFTTFFNILIKGK